MARKKKGKQDNKTLLMYLLAAVILAGGFWYSFDGTARIQRWLWNRERVPVNAHFYLHDSIPQKTIEVIGQRFYQPEWFTQGFTIYGRRLWVGTGQRGRSKVIEAGLYRDTTYQQVNLPDQYFGEGIAIVRDSLIYQLTYQSRVAFVYQMDNLERLRTFNYQTEGWGLEYWPEEDLLIQSDGTEKLYFRDPDDFSVVKSVSVKDDYGKITKINELELIERELWANLWGTETIIQIDPATGEVVSQVDAAPVMRKVRRNAITGVLNGIAYDAQREIIWLTGKNWPKRYAVRLVEDE